MRSVIVCPRDHTELTPRHVTRTLTFRGHDLEVESDILICSVCGFEGATVEATGRLQRAIVEAYNKVAEADKQIDRLGRTMLHQRPLKN